MKEDLSRYETIKFILINVIPLLIVAQFDKLLSSSNYSLLILPVLIFIFLNRGYFAKSLFVFIVIIFIGSHFNFQPEYGGTFALVSICIIFIYTLEKRRIYELRPKDSILGFILLILTVFCILGWITKSDIKIRYLIFSIITFSSFIIMLRISSSLIWNHFRIKVFITLLCIIMVYALFTAITNTLNIMPFRSTLWYSYNVEYSAEGSFFYSMLQRPSSAIAAMYFSAILPFLLINPNLLEFNIKKRILYFGIIASALVCLGSFSKSHSVALGVGFFLTTLFFIYLIKRKGSYIKRLNNFLLIGFIVFIVTEPFFHFETLIKRFNEQPKLISSFIDNPLLPKNTTREESFTMAMESLKRENWFIGYGYSNADFNRRAWLGEGYSEIAKLDFHNTYFSLPQLFGWVGTFAYIALFLLTILRMHPILRNIRVQMDYRILALSFFMLFIVFLLTEYTITSLSSPFYLMMLFILLGLANALYYNYRKGLLFSKIENQVTPVISSKK